jgi:hypothetical protein
MKNSKKVIYEYFVVLGYKSLAQRIDKKYGSKHKAIVRATELRLDGKQNIAVVRRRNGMNPRLIALYGTTDGETTTVRAPKTLD